MTTLIEYNGGIHKRIKVTSIYGTDVKSCERCSLKRAPIEMCANLMSQQVRGFSACLLYLFIEVKQIDNNTKLI